MSKDKLTDYDATASNNTDVGGISVAEGMLPSGVNNAIREQMSHLKDFASGTAGIDVLSLADDDASHAIKLQAPSAVTADTTFTLPDGDGASGQTMITDGAGTLSWAATYGNRNLIINGAMQVSQRGTSQTGVTSSGYASAPDRFSSLINGLGTWTLSQSSDAPDGFSSSYKWECTVADSSISADDYGILLQRMEGQNLQHLKKGSSNAESLTASFWVKSSKTGTYIFEMFENHSQRSISKSYTISSANTWEYKSITIPGDTVGTINNDNTQSLIASFWVAAGSDYSSGTLQTSWGSIVNANRAVGVVNLADTVGNTWQVTGVQLEVGSTATPFEHRSYGDELIQCQRYHTQTKSFTVEPGNQSTQGLCVLDTGVPMRARPTISLSGPLKVTDFGNTSTTQSSASVIHDGSSTDFANKYHLIRLQNFSGLNGRSWVSYLNSEYIILDAEL